MHLYISYLCGDSTGFIVVRHPAGSAGEAGVVVVVVVVAGGWVGECWDGW